jgi:superfamily I DNA/RNA helicase
MPGEELAEFTDRLFRLFQLVVATFTDPLDREALEDLADDYGMVLDERDVALYSDVLAAMISVGEEWARGKGVISFGDMLYLPVKWNLRPRRYRVVMADEAQDLNEIQLRLIEWACEGGRLIAVGDPWQSIYGWNGANPRAFERIRELSPNTVELPLSICYRCPKRVVRLAQDIVPHIGAGLNAPDGIVGEVDTQKLFAEAKAGDLVLCRVNGPLLSLCFSFLAARIPARVRGSDVGRTLIKTIRMIGAQPGFVYEQFPAFLAAWGERVRATLRPDDERAEKNLEDLQGSILACFTHYPAKTVEQLAEGIKSVFGDNMEKGVIWLSTVHKAKGLEARTVWIVHPEMLGRYRKRQTEAQRQEEMRVKYVALTRAKERMFFVVEPEGEGAPDKR